MSVWPNVKVALTTRGSESLRRFRVLFTISLSMSGSRSDNLWKASRARRFTSTLKNDVFSLCRQCYMLWIVLTSDVRAGHEGAIVWRVSHPWTGTGSTYRARGICAEWRYSLDPARRHVSKWRRSICNAPFESSLQASIATRAPEA